MTKAIVSRGVVCEDNGFVKRGSQGPRRFKTWRAGPVIQPVSKSHIVEWPSPHTGRRTVRYVSYGDFFIPVSQERVTKGIIIVEPVNEHSGTCRVHSLLQAARLVCSDFTCLENM